jgi:hypothetical protein
MAITVWAKGKFADGWKDSYEAGGVMLMCILCAHQLYHVLTLRNRSNTVPGTAEESTL